MITSAAIEASTSSHRVNMSARLCGIRGEANCVVATNAAHAPATPPGGISGEA